MENLLCGGWTPYRELNIEDKKIFEYGLEGFVGVSYDPFAVSTQIVAGTNYRFRCMSRLIGSDAHWNSVIEMFVSLDNEVHLVSIHKY